METDTTNDLLIGLRGDKVVALLGNKLASGITKAEAVRAAAYLIALTGTDMDEFQHVYDAVCSV